LADPSAYEPSYNFSGYQTVNPSSPLPASQLDTQLSDIATSTDELRDAVMDIRRSDGALANGVVGPDQLSAALSIGFTNRGTWADATAYSAGDGVVYGTTFYKASVAHTSAVATRPDTDADTWEQLFTFESIIVADGAITPPKLSADPSGFRTKIGLGTLAVENVAYLDSRVHALTEKTALHDDDEFHLIDTEAVNVGKKITWGDIVAAMLAEFDTTPVGAVNAYAGTAAPAGWLLCYGQAISRTTYADLFAITSTTYGSGDGSTTFNVPDLRGRVVAGQDDMGGSSANRLTNQSGGLNGDTLGASGGSETNTLATANLPAHLHAAGTLLMPNHGHPARYDNFDDGDQDTSGGIMLNSQNPANHAAHTGTPSDTRGDAIGGSGTAAITGSTANTGSGTAHNNVQPTLILNYIIYAGV
jgi:microcystin-dependent protein